MSIRSIIRPSVDALCAVALLAPLAGSQIVFAEPRDVPVGDENELILGLEGGDLDGDGLPELVAFLFWEPMIACFNAGDGVFLPTLLGPTSGGSSSALVDLDGDGELDLLSKHNGHEITCAFGDGDGAFGPQVVVHDEPWTGVGLGSTLGLLAADVTGDGVTDVVATNKHALLAGPASTHLYVGLGGGALAQQVTLADDQPTPFGSDEARWQMATDDVDRDGAADILAFTRQEATATEVAMSAAVVYRSVGSPTPTAVITPLGVVGRAGLFLDADGDGLLDALVESDGVGRLHLATGDGTFADPTTAYTVGPCELSKPLRFVGGDLDGDGRDDLLRACGDEVTVWRSEGAVGFALQGEPLDLPSSQQLRLIECDGDGRPDLVAASLGDEPSWGLSIASNLTYPPEAPFQDLGGGLPSSQHLMLQIAQGTLEPGTPFSVEASGVDPAGTAWLVIGLEHAELPFAGGVFGPFPDALFGPLPAGGQTSAAWRGLWPERAPSGWRAFAQVWVLESDGTWAATSTVALKTP